MVQMKFNIETRGSDAATREFAQQLAELCAKVSRPVRVGGFGYVHGPVILTAEFMPCDPFEAVKVARDLRKRIERVAAWAGVEAVTIALAR